MQLITLLSLWIIPFIIGMILLHSLWKKVPAYEHFVEGGKEGIKIAISIIPFLIGMLFAITVFRASGALDFFIGLMRPALNALGVPAEIVPLAFMRPISGTAALGLMTDITAVHGPDSLIGRMAAVIQGSTDTTFYVLTVYFGAVGIKKMGDALKVGLLADLVGITAAIALTIYLFG